MNAAFPPYGRAALRSALVMLSRQACRSVALALLFYSA